MSKKIQGPIREGDVYIEIDQKKGEWPYFRAFVTEDEKVALLIDCNASGTVVNQGQGLAAVKISPKKAAALRDFLDRILPT